jgi:hypothetical protein
MIKNYKFIFVSLLSTLFISSCVSVGPSIEESIENTNPDTNTSILTTENTSVESIITEDSTSEEISSEATSEKTSEETSNQTSGVVEKKYLLTDYYTIKETVVDINEDIFTYPDPYENVDIEDFYANYTKASSYVDSFYRMIHGLMCGEIINEDGSLKDNSNCPKDENGVYYKNALARFEVDQNGNRLSYTINTLDGEDYKIYRYGIYTSMNDVAAYLFAFNELPANYIPGASLKNIAYERFGELGRVNFNKYSGPSASKYQYEPYLKGQEDKSLFYRETDFGANVGENYYYTYNDKYGGNNTRQIFRFCVSNSYDSSYTYGKKDEYYETPNPTELDDRYVYYTYNHYNDFVEYLNYYNGFGDSFGNETAGNNVNQYVSSNPPTERVDAQLALFK